MRRAYFRVRWVAKGVSPFHSALNPSSWYTVLPQCQIPAHRHHSDYSHGRLPVQMYTCLEKQVRYASKVPQAQTLEEDEYLCIASLCQAATWS